MGGLTGGVGEVGEHWSHFFPLALQEATALGGIFWTALLEPFVPAGVILTTHPVSLGVFPRDPPLRNASLVQWDFTVRMPER